MSRLRVKLDGSLPWDPAIALEVMEKLFSSKSEPEHVDIIIENRIKSNKQWNKYYKDNNLKKQGYFNQPWISFNKTCKQFFEKIYGKKRSEQEHIDVVKENNIIHTREWIRYYKDNNLMEQRYYGAPWEHFRQSAKQFFEKIYGKKKTKQEHIDFIRKNKITGSTRWLRYWRDNNLREQGYLSVPWRISNRTCGDFFKEIYGKKKTEQEHIDFIKKNDIIHSKKWNKYYKDNNLTKQGYLYSPWRISKKTIEQFFGEIYGQKIYKTEQEHIDFIKENDIRTAGRWLRYWKDNNLQERSYYNSPWRIRDQTKKQFFELINYE